MEEIEITESLSFAFVGEDIHVDLTYKSPEELALLCFSVLSGQLTSYVIENAKEQMTDDEHELFMMYLTDMLEMVTSNIKEDKTLIKPSELFNMRVTK
jgi:hypothetical protein